MNRSGYRRTCFLATFVTFAPLTLTPVAFAQAAAYEELQNFSALLNFVRLNYVEQVDYGRLTRAAMQGVLESLDPHSYFLTEDDLLRLHGFESGMLAGVGLHLEQRGDDVVVLSVRRFGPADRAEVHPGDRLVGVDDMSISGLSARELEVRLLGDAGSKVNLRLERGARLEPEILELRLEREEFRGGSVADFGLREPGIGYVRLVEFREGASEELRKAVEDLLEREANVVLLDLRGNPGGLLDEAVEMASLFLDQAALVFSTRGRKAEMNREHRVRQDGKFRDLDLVVLIDEGSASAAEVLAASLQDNDRALLVGRRTFGKALIQVPFVLPRGDLVMLTVGRVFAPSGRLIQRDYDEMTGGQYRARAGTEPEAATATYRTAGGRAVRGGGGVRPDVELPGPAELPPWWAESVRLGLPLEVATEVAADIPGTPEAWAIRDAAWESMLLDPFLERARSRLSVAAEPTQAERQRMARVLAGLAAGVRWGRARQERFLLLADPDVRFALEAYRTHGIALDGPEPGSGP